MFTFVLSSLFREREREVCMLCVCVCVWGGGGGGGKVGDEGSVGEGVMDQ